MRVERIVDLLVTARSGCSILRPIAKLQSVRQPEGLRFGCWHGELATSKKLKAHVYLHAQNLSLLGRAYSTAGTPISDPFPRFLSHQQVPTPTPRTERLDNDVGSSWRPKELRILTPTREFRGRLVSCLGKSPPRSSIALKHK